MRRAKMIAGTALLIYACVAFSAADEATDQSLGVGQVSFNTSCGPAVEAPFNRAVAILHSFWFDEAIKSFRAITETDPDCAIAFWGLAMSYTKIAWGGPPSESQFRKGAEAARQGLIAKQYSARERGFVEAIADYYDGESLSHSQRASAHEKRMAKLYESYGSDNEVALFYALALLADLDPDDRSLSGELEAGRIAEHVFALQPNHPGAAHYVIHSYDFPSLAERALPAARKYAEIAPGVAHALHMPSHIFVRLGLWQDAIRSNREALKAAEGAGDQAAAMHTMGYLIYANLQSGQDEQALRVLERARAVAHGKPDSLLVVGHLADMEARYALERRAWAEAASLQTSRYERFVFPEALVRAARAIGTARTGDPWQAKIELERMGTLESALSGPTTGVGAAATGGDNYRADRVGIWRAVAAAWSDVSRGDLEAARNRMHEAGDRADTSIFIGSLLLGPDGLVHVDENAGDLLLETGRYEEAFAMYTRSLKIARKRFNSLYGAGRAAELAGRDELARKYYAQLVEQCHDATTRRPELAIAKAYLSQ